MRLDDIYNEAVLLNKKLNTYPSTLSKNKKKATYFRYFKLLKKAAYQGHREAYFDYGQQFENIGFLGMQNPLYDPKRCIYWYTKAVNKNHAESCNNLAAFYENGEGVKKDINKAKSLYKKGSELGSKTAKKNYALIIKQISSGVYKY